MAARSRGLAADDWRAPAGRRHSNRRAEPPVRESRRARIQYSRDSAQSHPSYPPRSITPPRQRHIRSTAAPADLLLSCAAVIEKTPAARACFRRLAVLLAESPESRPERSAVSPISYSSHSVALGTQGNRIMALAHYSLAYCVDVRLIISWGLGDRNRLAYSELQRSLDRLFLVDTIIRSS